MATDTALSGFGVFAVASALLLWWGLRQRRRGDDGGWGGYTVSFAGPALAGSVLMVIIGLTLLR